MTTLWHEAMIGGKGSFNGVPLMAEEEVQLSFGERHGLKMETGIDRNTMVLTDRRLIRLSRVGANWEVVFVSLKDAQVAEVRIRSRSKRPLLRVALLLAGAGAALIAIDFLPIALVLAAALGLGGVYHLFHYLTVPHEGYILFRAGPREMVIPFQGDMADQAYTFVNRFSQLKEASTSAPRVGEEDRMGAEALPGQGLRGTDETEIGPVPAQGGKSPLESPQEELPKEEQAKSLDEGAEPNQPAPSEQLSEEATMTPSDAPAPDTSTLTSVVNQKTATNVIPRPD